MVAPGVYDTPPDQIDLSFLSDRRFDEIVSLGESCSTKYQLAREQHERAGCVESHDLVPTQAVAGSNIFDWLISGPDAVSAAIEHEFASIFDRGKLMIGTDGLVRHIDYGLRFDHAFTLTDGRVLSSTVDLEHPAKQAKYVFLADRFMQQLREASDILFVMSFNSEFEACRKVADVIRRKRGSRPFHLLGMLGRDSPRGWVHQDQQCTVYEISTATSKPAVQQWQGDDDAWRTALRPITF